MFVLNSSWPATRRMRRVDQDAVQIMPGNCDRETEVPRSGRDVGTVMSRCMGFS